MPTQRPAPAVVRLAKPGELQGPAPTGILAPSGLTAVHGASASWWWLTASPQDSRCFEQPLVGLQHMA